MLGYVHPVIPGYERHDGLYTTLLPGYERHAGLCTPLPYPGSTPPRVHPSTTPPWVHPTSCTARATWLRSDSSAGVTGSWAQRGRNPWVRASQDPRVPQECDSW